MIFVGGEFNQVYTKIIVVFYVIKLVSGNLYVILISDNMK